LPVTEKLSKQVFSLPLYPGMPKAHVKTVIDAVQKAAQ
jgi:dTDP-4-amino-4,6-dideoxygalactose transaminase